MNGLKLMGPFTTTDFTATFADGQIVRTAIDKAYEAGDGAKVPMVIGANDADGFFFSRDLDKAYAPVAADRAGAEKVYDPAGDKNPKRIGVAVSADMMFLEPARHVSRIIAAKGQPVYTYRYGYVPDYLRAVMPGALDASELPFVFDTVDARHGAKTTVNDRAAARLVYEYWVNFAKSGVPSSLKGGAWTRFDPAADNVMIFDAKGARKQSPTRSPPGSISSIIW